MTTRSIEGLEAPPRKGRTKRIVKIVGLVLTALLVVAAAAAAWFLTRPPAPASDSAIATARALFPERTPPSSRVSGRRSTAVVA